MPALLCFTLLSLLASDSSPSARQNDIEQEFIKQYDLCKNLQRELDQHPVTRWRREIERNKRAIATLEKQLRDMVRLENIEPIEELREKNEKQQKQIKAKRKGWEALVKQLDAARVRLEALKKQLGPARAEEILKGQTE